MWYSLVVQRDCRFVRGHQRVSKNPLPRLEVCCSRMRNVVEAKLSRKSGQLQKATWMSMRSYVRRVPIGIQDADLHSKSWAKVRVKRLSEIAIKQVRKG